MTTDLEPIDNERLPAYRALAPSHRGFVDHYFQIHAETGEYNSREAAIRAGYSRRTAKQLGSRLSLRADVQAAIIERQLLVADRIDLTREWILNALKLNAVACLTPGETHNPAAANKALELLGRERRMFVDRRLVGVTSLDNASEEEILEFLGGEPDPEELSAAAGALPAGHA